MKTLKLVQAIVMVLVISATVQPWAQEGEGPGPVINPDFPITSGDSLSPPIVSPVGECAQAVHVSGFLPHAVITVFVNGTTQVGEVQSYFAETDITLTQTLVLGDKVTATQTVNGFTSAPSVDPVVVGPYPATLNTPVVGSSLFTCGRIVPASNLNAGTRLDVFSNGGATPIGSANVTGGFQPVFTQSLNAPDQITAVQTACPALPAKKIVSPTSAPVTVQNGPTPPPAPTLEPYPVGADAVILDGLFVGAFVQMFDHGTPAGGGFATASRNRAPLNPAATSTSSVSATQALCSPSPQSTPQPPSSTLNAPVIVSPVCEGTHYVTVQGTYPNSIVVLFRNGTIAGMAGGIVGDLKMALGAGAVWTLGDEIHVVQYVVNVVSPPSNSVFADCDTHGVLTQHNDNSRSGAYTAETSLTPASVSANFGFLYKRNVDGDIVSQPLYMRGVRTAAGLKNLIFITTSKNNVYAFDADNSSTDPTTAPIWQRNLCSSVKSSVCGETWSGLVGVTSTPVIDPSTNTLYAVPRCSDGTGNATDGAIFIHAINVADGSDRVPRIQISATDPGNAAVHFDFHCQRQRPGLLLSQGVVYAGFATFSCDASCGNIPYHGWLLGYRASDLQQVAVYDTSPGAGQAGIWQTGNGVAASSDGSIYFETGNGPTSEPLQDSFVKLTPTGPSGLTLFKGKAPNDADILSNGDTDLGSGGPMLLPNGRLIGGGKQGRYYVLDQGTMNLSQDSTPDALGYDGFQAFINTYHNDSTKDACPAAGGAAGCDPTGKGTTAGPACFIDPKRYSVGELCGPNIHGGPVFLQTSNTSGFVYEMPEKDFLKGFKYDFTTKTVTELPALTAAGTLAKPPTDGMPGGFSSTSANGMNDGIVWTSMPYGDGQWNPVPGRIAAFDALTLKQIWSDSQDVTFAKSVPPTVADGKVIRATAANQILVYGLGGTKTMAAFGSGSVPGPIPGTLDLTPGRCTTIDEKYADYSGEIGLLGTPTGPETAIGDPAGGHFRNFLGSVSGITNLVTSKRMRRDAKIPTCSMPPESSEALHSSIYWNPQLCAHVVEGSILKLWLHLGGVNSALGYPITDEGFTHDRLGRVSVFEHGQIRWYPNKGAFVVGREDCDDDKDDKKKDCDDDDKRDHGRESRAAATSQPAN
jgi:hypothetical protein